MLKQIDEYSEKMKFSYENKRKVIRVGEKTLILGICKSYLTSIPHISPIFHTPVTKKVPTNLYATMVLTLVLLVRHYLVA